MYMTDTEADLMIAKARIAELTEERDAIMSRLQHLCKSKTIACYDEKDAQGRYKRDIECFDILYEGLINAQDDLIKRINALIDKYAKMEG